MSLHRFQSRRRPLVQIYIITGKQNMSCNAPLDTAGKIFRYSRRRDIWTFAQNNSSDGARLIHSVAALFPLTSI